MKKPEMTAFEDLPDEEKKRIAEDRDRELRNLLKSMSQREKSLIGILAKLFGAPGETNKERVIWHGLATSANTGMEGPGSPKLALIYFQNLVWLCTWCLAGELTEATRDLSSFRDLEVEARRTSRSPEEVLAGRASTIQEQLRTMLLWLADPRDCKPEVRREGFRLLLQNSTESAIDFDIDLNDEFDDTGNQGYPMFYWKHIFGYETIMSPIARFIFDQLEQYHAGKLVLDKAVPLIVCKRPECGKFVVPKRGTREFCSDSCRTLHRQKTKREAHAAYMRIYRAANY